MQAGAAYLSDARPGFRRHTNYPPEEYHGLIVLRLRRQDKAHVVGVIEQLLPMLETEPLANRL